MNIKLARIVLAITCSWSFFAQPVNAGRNSDRLSGGALGIIQCQYVSGKTQVSWRVIVNGSNMPINGVNFTFKVGKSERTVFEGVIPPQQDYQTVQYFDSFERTASVSGEAYHIKFSAIHRYYLRNPLEVRCDN